MPFTGPRLAQILLGQIADWSDERLCVQNKKGNSVKPSIESVNVATEASSFQYEMRFPQTDPDGEDSYPIADRRLSPP